MRSTLFQRRYPKSIHDKREERGKFVISFIGLMNVPAIARGEEREG